MYAYIIKHTSIQSDRERSTNDHTRARAHTHTHRVRESTSVCDDVCEGVRVTEANVILDRA